MLDPTGIMNPGKLLGGEVIASSTPESPDAAEAALAAWKEVPTAIMERNNRARRVAGMRRDIGEFEKNANNAIEELALEEADGASFHVKAEATRHRLSRLDRKLAQKKNSHLFGGCI